MTPAASLADAQSVGGFQRALRDRYGIDFTGYRPASFTRRLHSLTRHLRLETIDDATALLIDRPDMVQAAVDHILVPVSELFREPATLRALRDHVFPTLAGRDRVTVWHAGCARGEEVFSLAILLHEAGLYPRCRIVASDLSASALDAAQRGIYPIQDMQAASGRYADSGGRHSLSLYYHAGYDGVRFDRDLLANVEFRRTNLADAEPFCTADIILCRNVLIYFDRPLQARVYDLFARSLAPHGALCVGTQETPRGHDLPFVRSAYNHSILFPDAPLAHRSAVRIACRSSR
ncbi:protein-glutamate O-methyltransferase CheR [Sphingomonas sp. RHCKR47]|uniref:CheR family methyltransferase n=1 Tax=Sphingomonas citricola TaxID=2862498 RepID=UPI001CA53ECA|nr:protein-glutamate O-methyltransferase CheR [Sphingomonas citricola]MBW6524874.1 protein-glutamate O-methyltransferase CheR [Sphingomonas citricola]